jgi:hypothetical protein
MSTLPKRLQIMNRLCHIYFDIHFTITNDSVTARFKYPAHIDDCQYVRGCGTRISFEELRFTMKEFDNLYPTELLF